MKFSRMKKLKKVRIYFIIFAFLFFTYTNVYAQNYIVNLPIDVIKTINTNKISDLSSSEEVKDELKQYLYKFEDFDDEIKSDLINNKRGYRFFNLISIDNAVNDVDYLFRLLKYGYAGYQYFGGDKKFLSVKNKIIYDIENKDNIFSLISVNSLKKIIYDNLNFIQDGHFSIENMQLCKDYYLFTTKEYIFLKDEVGFYTTIDNHKKYLISVNGKNPSDYIKLSLNQEGKIVYCLGILSQDGEELILNLFFKSENTDRISNIRTTLYKQNNKGVKNKYQFSYKTPYNSYEISGIPIIEHRSTAPTPENIIKLEEFVEEAKNFRDDKFLIIDIRGNSGGNEIYPYKWVENYTEENIGYGNVSCSLATNTALNMLINSVQEIYKDPKLISQVKNIVKVNNFGWSEIEYSKNKRIKNENLIIVLFDNQVASGGESFVRFLKQLDNVIFIGSNTSGVKTFGNMGMCKLPYSQLEINFGISLFFDWDLEFREGLGYLPDFWVDPTNSLNIALKFILNYFEKN